MRFTMEPTISFSEARSIICSSSIFFDLERFQTLGTRNFHAAVIPSSILEGRITDPMLLTQSRRAHAFLMLRQNANDLGFA